jgi:hypothetical protein
MKFCTVDHRGGELCSCRHYCRCRHVNISHPVSIGRVLRFSSCNFPWSLSSCSTEQGRGSVLLYTMCTEKGELVSSSKYLVWMVYSIKNRGRRKMFTTRAKGASWVSRCSEPAQHLLRPLYNYGLCRIKRLHLDTPPRIHHPIHQLIRATCVMTTYTLLFSSVLYLMGTHSQVWIPGGKYNGYRPQD